MKEITISYIEDFMSRHADLDYLKSNIMESIELLTSLRKENKILLCGNGGSASDCEHIAGELLKSFTLKREITSELKNNLIDEYGEEGMVIADNLQQGIKAISLTSFSAYNTAFLNDCDGKFLFAQLVNSLGINDDVLIAISTSGNSPNVVYATKLAKIIGMKIIALTGENGGKLRELADIVINVPSNIVYRIQEYHLPIYHLICLCVESELFEC